MNPDIIREIKRRYGSTQDAELAAELNIGVDVVVRVAEEHALGKDKKRFKVGRMPRWTLEQEDAMRASYACSRNEEMALVLKRTVKSVVAKAHQMGLKKHETRLKQMGAENVSKRRDRQ